MFEERPKPASHRKTRTLYRWVEINVTSFDFCIADKGGKVEWNRREKRSYGQANINWNVSKATPIFWLQTAALLTRSVRSGKKLALPFSRNCMQDLSNSAQYYPLLKFTLSDLGSWPNFRVHNVITKVGLQVVLSLQVPVWPKVKRMMVAMLAHWWGSAQKSSNGLMREINHAFLNVVKTLTLAFSWVYWSEILQLWMLSKERFREHLHCNTSFGDLDWI